MTAYVATIVSTRTRRSGKARGPRVAKPVPVAADRVPSRQDVAVATAAGLAGAVGLGAAALVALLFLIGAAGEGGTDTSALDEGALATVSE